MCIRDSHWIFKSQPTSCQIEAYSTTLPLYAWICKTWTHYSGIRPNFRKSCRHNDKTTTTLNSSNTLLEADDLLTVVYWSRNRLSPWLLRWQRTTYCLPANLVITCSAKHMIHEWDFSLQQAFLLFYFFFLLKVFREETPVLSLHNQYNS